LAIPAGLGKENMRASFKTWFSGAVFGALLGAAVSLPAIGATPANATTDSVQQAFTERFPGITIDAVRTTPFPNLYEVQIGADLVYTDAEVDYIMQGALVDARTRTDLTAQRIEQLNQVSFDSLPLDLAVKQVKGDGSRKLAVFEDPNCGYCKQLHRVLEGIDNVTVYTFLYPILSPDSHDKARDIWCAPDRAATWKDWMVRNRAPAAAQCDTPIQEVLALGRKLRVQGTPAMIFSDGTRTNGMLPGNQLSQRLDTLAAKN
jgi:thiol:disulfide interchange protein DsbC